MSIVYLALGSNLGNREDYLQRALIEIGQSIGPVLSTSDIYETQPWSNAETQRNYLNQVARIATTLEPKELLKRLLELEKFIGRQSREKWASREIDIDILFYDQMIYHKDELVIPHPFMHLRSFVLTPLCELAPDYFHPVFRKTISHLLENCSDTGKVTTFAGANG